MRYSSLLSFIPVTVTLVASIIYLSITTSLLIIHETVPPAPKDLTSYRGFNLTEAWSDLQELSNGYHPFNSHRNDEVRNWLLVKIKETLDTSGVNWVLERSGQEVKSQPSKYLSMNKNIKSNDIKYTLTNELSSQVFVFDDLTSNFTSNDVETKSRKPGASKYFEGSNIIVYIRGTKDQRDEWWKPSPPYVKHQHGRAGVLVNAHLDSVSTGYGTTDDGVGVITALQLLKFFTIKGNEPERGLILLFNNNEEDGLYGSKAFLPHPMASFVNTFLNLEGAGAGGRANLFRSTDLEVTRAYAHSPNPFGNVIGADAFSLKFIRSDTDYTVFRAEGYSGLDVAFYVPRSRYHTDEDDIKHTTINSVWHMLSASVETVKYLTTDKNRLHDGQKDGKKSKINNTRPKGVWFDLFGQAFIVFGLQTLFAWSLTILIATPLILLVISYILIRQDKLYLFTSTTKPSEHISEWIPLQGWRGAFRFPIVLLISSTLTIGTAFLLKKINPLIIYSSQYSVWCMFLSLYFCVFWLLMSIFNAIRPSALHRIYVLLWMFLLGWIILVVVTIFEDRFQISSGYIFVFNQVAIFLATLIGLCDLFALPKKSSLIEKQSEQETRDSVMPSSATDALDVIGREAQDNQEEEELPAVEATPLLGNKLRRSLTRTTFSKGYRRLKTDHHNDMNGDVYGYYGYEQKWSNKLPSLTWLLQILILVPFNLIITEQIGLLLVSPASQTGVDGSDLLVPYLITAVFSILIFFPLSPFIHRITYHIPMFLFFILIGTLTYNLAAFPFSAQNRYKAFFQQTVNLDDGSNQVTLAGIEEYIRDIISYVPSATGQSINCTMNPEIREGVSFCSYEGKVPNVLNGVTTENISGRGYEDWLNYNITRIENSNKAIFEVFGRETKACVIRFNLPFSSFYVHGAATHHRHWVDVSDTESQQIKLWHRDWNRKWVVEVEWPVSIGKEPGEEGRSGEVVCLWNDHNKPDTIPSLDELERYMPVWATKTKLTDGLVEGSKAFAV